MDELSNAIRVTTRRPEETRQLGAAVGRMASVDQCIALDGDLGVGKTQWVHGIATGAMVADLGLVSSPTYVLLNVYLRQPEVPASKTLFHLDAYRVPDAAALEAVGWDELFGQQGVIVVEWAERVRAILPEDCLYIHGQLMDATTRVWALNATGVQSAALLQAVQRECGGSAAAYNAIMDFPG